MSGYFLTLAGIRKHDIKKMTKSPQEDEAYCFRV